MSQIDSVPPWAKRRMRRIAARRHHPKVMRWIAFIRNAGRQDRHATAEDMAGTRSAGHMIAFVSRSHQPAVEQAVAMTSWPPQGSASVH
ncbi:hypothetical protein [Methylobacterium oryzisoli]|uniref:hypothetical protein n=1 Tax=Methylobacterium oryzisoli TaxID=3385502 RepID=UPI003892C1D8